MNAASGEQSENEEVIEKEPPRVNEVCQNVNKLTDWIEIKMIVTPSIYLYLQSIRTYTKIQNKKNSEL